MIYFYGMARGNARTAKRLYTERFPNRQHSSRSIITECFRRAIETGYLVVHQSCDRALRRHVNNDERILRAFEENPQNNIRRVSRTLGKSYCTRWKWKGCNPFSCKTRCIMACGISSAQFTRCTLFWGFSLNTRSPDLNLDYFVWGYIKALVEHRRGTQDEARNEIIATFQTITPDMQHGKFLIESNFVCKCKGGTSNYYFIRSVKRVN